MPSKRRFEGYLSIGKKWERPEELFLVTFSSLAEAQKAFMEIWRKETITFSALEIFCSQDVVKNWLIDFWSNDIGVNHSKYEATYD